jgi:amino acid adenylation domain-containing protein
MNIRSSADRIAYFRRELHGSPAPVSFPADFLGEARDVSRVSLAVTPGQAAELRAFCARERISVQAAALAVVQILVARSSGQDDVVIGVRIPPSVLPLRACVEGPRSFAEIARTAHASLADATAHAVSLSELVNEGVCAPKLPVVFAYVDEDASATSAVADAGAFELQLVVAERDGTLGAHVDFDASRFDRASIARLAEHLGVLLIEAVRNGDRRVSELPLMTDAERRKVVVEWNATETDFPSQPGLAELFAAQVARAPDAIAIEHGATSISYAELDRRSNQLAHRLRREGARRGDLVGVFVERAPEMVVAALAILKAGAAYVPIDPSYPIDRVAVMLEDTAARLVIGHSALLAPVKERGVATLTLDDQAGFAAEPSSAPTPASSGADLAYVMFTSGSTGRPKGVCVPQRAVARLVLATNYVKLSSEHRIAQASNASFDAATFEIWGALLNGARLVILDKGTVLDPRRLADALAQQRITTLFLTTALFNQIAELRPDAFAGVHDLMFGGEQVNVESVRRILPHKPRRLLHVYGPTETTTFATWRLVDDVPAAAATIPIGRPLANTTVYVLDASLSPVPVGVPGEIYIGGAGTARGYARRPELTAARFVPDPFGPPGSTLYRTGDLGRFVEDGSVEFVGRIDQQVKIRGFRIELGEVESALVHQATVSEAVVVAHESVTKDKSLVAYVVPAEGKAFDVEAARAEMRRVLPDYMVPSAFVLLDALPLTANGKVDRKALPAPDLAASNVAYVEPRTATERKLAEIWASVLGAEKIGARDDFFARGGHSLRAMHVASRVARELGVDLTVRSLFERPILEELARDVDASSASEARSRKQAPLVKISRKKNTFPLSPLQERLWFLDRLDPGSTAYIVASAVRLEGALDVPRLEGALVELVRRHESLRTTFAERGGKGVQVIGEAVPELLTRRDAGGLSEPEKARAIQEEAERQVTTPFDLTTGPLFRATLLRLGERDHALFVAMHHIVSDGWSVGVMAQELERLYGGGPSSMPELTVQYVDYAVWERQRLNEGAIREQLAYWRDRLAGAPPALELPTDRPRPPKQRHRGAKVSARIAPAVAERLRDFARERGGTLYMALLASFGALLGRLSGQRDVVVATPVVTRPHPDTEHLIGFFMNTLALRVDLGGDPSFEELFARAREASLGGFANQGVPFERVVVELNPVRDASRNPIAQVSLNLLNLPDFRVRLPGVVARPIDATQAGSKFDATLYVEETDGLALELVYDPDLFDEARMARLLERFVLLCGRVVERPKDRVLGASLLLDAERAALPDPAAPLDAGEHRSILAAFDERVRTAPDRPAVVDPRRSWTYAELGARTNRLAHLLRARGVGAGDVVGIHADRNAATVWAILAVMKAGAAFCIADAAYPPARIVEQLRIAEPRAWIDASEGAARSAELEAVLPPPDRRVDLGGAEKPWESMPDSSPGDAPSADARAYVVFTSGTTGGPKAIEGTHGPLAHFVEWHTRTHGLDANDRFSALSGLAHDPFLRDVLVPLSIGASIRVPPPSVRLEPDALVAWMASEGVTVCHVTPSLAEVMTLSRGSSLDALRWTFFGGEALRGELVTAFRKIAPRARLVNFYGATETPQAVASHPIANESVSGAVPIGRGIDGVQLLVLDAGDHLAGVDEEGEICVRTRHLARYRDGEARGFAASPFSGDPADRVYRTGDRGRYRADGAVEVVGRADDQVKVRGFRVELSEVEAAVRAQAGVTQAAVVYHEPRRALVAYVTGEADPSAVTAGVRARLPDYMVPSTVVKLDALPLTANGKVDRRALPAPDERSADARDPGAAPEEGSVEATIIAVWKQVLEIEHVGLHDDFFDLGGHSLLATQIAARLRDELGIDVPVRMIFEAPVVAELAARLTEALLQSASPEELDAALRG